MDDKIYLVTLHGFFHGDRTCPLGEHPVLIEASTDEAAFQKLALYVDEKWPRKAGDPSSEPPRKDGLQLTGVTIQRVEATDIVPFPRHELAKLNGVYHQWAANETGRAAV